LINDSKSPHREVRDHKISELRDQSSNTLREELINIDDVSQISDSFQSFDIPVETIDIPEVYKYHDDVQVPDEVIDDPRPSDKLESELQSANDDKTVFSGEESFSGSEDDEYIIEDEVTLQLRSIQSTFIKHSGMSRGAKDDVIHLLKTIKRETQEKLKKGSRSLLPTRMKYEMYSVPPGEMAYLGIANVLNFSKAKLYDPSKNIISLSVNIDGLPLYRSSAMNLWPILGRIDKNKIFPIAIYAGKKKPKCSNLYLKHFTEELLALKRNGITLHGKTYRFSVHKMLFDARAKAYVLGVKYHNSKRPCTKCHVRGRSVIRKGYATIAKNRNRGVKALCFLDFTAKKKGNSDLKVGKNDVHIPYCDENAECSHGKFIDMHEELDEYMTDDSDYNSQTNTSSESESEPPAPKLTAKQIKRAKKRDFRRHFTILTKLYVDLVKQIPIDYLHCVLLGIMKKLLKIWKNEIKLLSEQNKILFNSRIGLVRRQYEFQRIPETLEFLCNYKGTQYRVFLLYTGAFVLEDLLPPDYYKNFCYLVTAIRLMAKQVPYDEDDERRRPYLGKVAKEARILIKEFITSAVRLYGKEFVVYNVHNLWHLPDDYEEYGCLDDFSNFAYESILGQVKRCVKSGYKPLKQVLNNFSDRLATDLYATDSCDLQDCLPVYFEQPELCQEVGELDED